MSRINEKIYERLDSAKNRLNEIDATLADPSTASDSHKLTDLYKERADLAETVELYTNYRNAQKQLAEAQELVNDPELKEMAAEEIAGAQATLGTAEAILLEQLQPKDSNDAKDCFLEIRAGVGGLEACLFSGDLLRMYSRWAENNKIKFEPLSTSSGEAGGFKEIIVKLSGSNAFGLFKHEGGAHRVQRVPDTESQGRIHTSVCTVAVMPEVKITDVGIESSDLRVDTYRSSGAGGQHVNTTDSAVRVTHLPTGIVAECQNDRSQHRNREKAMEMLIARVNRHFRSQQESEVENTRRKMVGSGERNEKIRTYNYPQGRVTDHRIGMTVRNLSQVLDGSLENIYKGLRQAERAEQMETGL